MTAKNQQKINDLRGKKAYYRRALGDQIKNLPSYYAENGPGVALKEVLADIVKQHTELEHCETEMQRIRYEDDGLFLASTPSGPGALPAHT